MRRGVPNQIAMRSSPPPVLIHIPETCLLILYDFENQPFKCPARTLGARCEGSKKKVRFGGIQSLTVSNNSNPRTLFFLFSTFVEDLE